MSINLFLVSHQVIHFYSRQFCVSWLVLLAGNIASMRVEKLDLCKQTLHLLLRELHHHDRFGLISFSADAKIEVPLLNISDEHKRMALHAIDHLAVRGVTNIASAISLVRC